MLPLCVDLDGTLILNDVTLIAYGDFIYKHQLRMLQVLFWQIIGGRALVKHKLAERIDIESSELTYNERFLEYLRNRKKNGGNLYLATACNEKYASAICKSLGIFDGFFASNSKINLRAEAKGQKLVDVFGEKGFAYAGNSKDDLKVWEHAGEVIVVNPSSGVLQNLRCNNYQLFE